MPVAPTFKNVGRPGSGAMSCTESSAPYCWGVVLVLVMDAGHVFQGLERAAGEDLGSELEMLFRQRGAGAQSDISVGA